MAARIREVFEELHAGYRDFYQSAYETAKS